MTSNSTTTLSPVQERSLLFVLAAVQFMNILDFVIMMPLGPKFMAYFDISPQEFAFIVSSYTLSAALFGFLGAFFIDAFDRKTALLVLFAGFAVGTLCCAVAPTHHWLIAARATAGAFGGILGAMIFSIVGDAVPEARRGAATGTIMSAFSVASIFGVPFSLYLANQSHWHAPFWMLGGASLLVLAVAYFVMPSMTGHLAPTGTRRESPAETMRVIFSEPRHLYAFALMMVLMMAGFSVIQFIAPYMISNVGLTDEELPYIYLSGGLFTLVSSRAIGKLADRYGKWRVFNAMAMLSMVPLLLITQLPRVPLWIALAVTTVFTVMLTGRLIPATAMVTAAVEPRHRGSFMSINSSLQSLATSAASQIAGLMILKTADGSLAHFDQVGYFAVAMTLLSLYLARQLRPRETESPMPASAPIPAE